MDMLQMYKEICNFEENALSKCNDIVNSYLLAFAQYGYTLKVCQEWTNFLKRTRSNQRLPFINGYECQIYCEVQKNGVPVKVKRNDEYDFSILADVWVVSSIYRKWFKLAVDLVPIENFVAEDVEELLKSVRSI
jgi:hypothetical protein